VHGCPGTGTWYLVPYQVLVVSCEMYSTVYIMMHARLSSPALLDTPFVLLSVSLSFYRFYPQKEAMF
jgi:hypothetical protein